jgi:Arc/MetJ-type ribon-helix-helix transcriptional regulator
MSTQIAVRLPDDMVAFIDELVSHGEAASRAQVVSQALERERRRRGAEKDAAIYAADRATEDPDSLDAFAAYTSRTALDDLD